MRVLKAMFGAAALVAFLAPGVHADEWNKRTYLTFSGPVQIPGGTLPAGTYTFEIADPNASRHVIRVSEKDTNKPIGLFMTIPNERLEAPSDNLIMFAERPAGVPQAIQAWFYPGDRIGEEFVYPKSEAVLIAKANKKAVLATADESNANRSETERMSAIKGASVGRVDETGKMTSSTAQSTTAGTSATAAPANSATGSRPSRAETTTARTETTPRTTTAPRSRNNAVAGTTGTQADQSNANRRQLPRTASNLVELELMSVVALGAAFAARRLRRFAESAK